MKMLVLSFLFLAFSAHASSFEDNCANADGTAQWEQGHNDNRAVFKKMSQETYERIEAEFDVHQLEIKLVSEHLIHEEEDEGQCWASYDKWYSTKATITPKEEVKERFLKLFPKGSFSDFVICHNHISGETYGDGCEKRRKQN